MPLLSGGTIATPPPVVVPRDIPRVTYIDPTGVEWPLDEVSRGILAQRILGLGLTPVSYTTDDHPYGGTTVRHIQPGARTLVVTINVWAATRGGFTALWRGLGEALALSQDPTLPPGLIVIAEPDGTSREIEVRCQDGFDNSSGFDTSDGGWRYEDTAVVSLYAPDGMWRDREYTVITRENSASAPFLAPFMTISSSNVLGITAVTNPGSVATWPEWTITGPMDGLTATNNATGESFTLDMTLTAHGALTAGETATIVTDPLLGQVITGPGDEDWTTAVDWPTAVLWPLYRGEQQVEFAASGATTGAAVELRFKARWRTA